MKNKDRSNAETLRPPFPDYKAAKRASVLPNNKLCVATMKSVTHAVKGRQVLLSYGIKSEQVRLDGVHMKRGCSAGLSFRCSESERVRRLFFDNGVDFSDIYISD